MLTGRCLCGTVRYEMTRAPEVMMYCHCTHCRRASGSSFATNVIVHRDDFKITEGADALGTYESRPGKLRHFCSRCGSPVYNETPGGADWLPVRAGTLDADPGIRPQAHIWVKSKTPWFEIRDGLPEHEEWATD